MANTRTAPTARAPGATILRERPVIQSSLED